MVLTQNSLDCLIRSEVALLFRVRYSDVLNLLRVCHGGMLSSKEQSQLQSYALEPSDDAQTAHGSPGHQTLEYYAESLLQKACFH